MKSAIVAMIFANVAKCVLYPAVILTSGYIFGLDGIALGILFLMSASPTAAASYIMAKKTNSNPVLAANFVVSTSVVAIPIMMVALMVLLQYGIIAPASV
jgi:predicted permease